jgi:hypothetical protein
LRAGHKAVRQFSRGQGESCGQLGQKKAISRYFEEAARLSTGISTNLEDGRSAIGVGAEEWRSSNYAIREVEESGYNRIRQPCE